MLLDFALIFSTLMFDYSRDLTLLTCSAILRLSLGFHGILFGSVIVALRLFRTSPSKRPEDNRPFPNQDVVTQSLVDMEKPVGNQDVFLAHLQPMSLSAWGIEFGWIYTYENWSDDRC